MDGYTGGVAPAHIECGKKTKKAIYVLYTTYILLSQRAVNVYIRCLYEVHPF